MGSGPETRLVQRMIRHLARRGAWTMKVHGGPNQAGGVPDILACYKGYFLGFEVKVPGKEHTVTKRQAYSIDRIITAGGLAQAVSSTEEIDVVLAWIDEYDQSGPV